LPHQDADVLAWQNEGFEQPFLFDSHSIASMHRVVEANDQRNQRPSDQLWVFELYGDNLLAGQLLEANEQRIQILSPTLGELSLERTWVRSISRVAGSSALLSSGFDVPSWHQQGSGKQWVIDRSGLSTKTLAAKIEGRVDLPDRFELSMSLRWGDLPQFSLLLATAGRHDRIPQPQVGFVGLRNNQDAQANGLGQQTAFASIETWSNTLVLVRESADKADIATLDQLNSDSSVDLTIWIDQPAGKVAARTRGGKVVELDRLSEKSQPSRSSIVIANYGQQLSVERFEIRSWDGTLPSSRPNSGQVVLANGQSLEAGIVGFDAQSNQWILQTKDGPRQIARDQLLSGFVAASKPSSAANADTDDAASGGKQSPSADTASKIDRSKSERSQDIEMTLTDRTLLKGRLLGASQGQLKFQASALQQELLINTEAIAELVGSTQEPKSTAVPAGTLAISIGDSQYFGSLLDNTPVGSTQALHWQPALSRLSSPVSTKANGTIRPHAPVAKAAASPDSQATERNVDADAGMRVRLRRVLPRNVQPEGRAPQPVRSEPGESGSAAQASLSLHLLYFRNGDMAQVTVSSIDSAGVHFQSQQTKSTFAAHEQIDRLVFSNSSRGLDWTDPQRQRLLTVPRASKNDPPKHLVIATSGDVVRGQLVELTQKKLTIEVRGQLMKFSIAEVSEIAWLYQRHWQTEGSDEEMKSTNVELANLNVATEMSDFSVHAISQAQHGVTLRPQKIEYGVLHGTSDLLGETSVQLDRLSQMFFGSDVRTRVMQLGRTQYPLVLATQPRDATGNGEPGSISQQHPLVGLLAPEFSLPTLSDQKFVMKEKQGKFLILDFWASWCGPCMQALPELDAAIAEFGSNQVELVAINIQEAKSRVQSTAERLGLACLVALDLDGQVAAAYDVSAIPQTVIIDRKGKITHLILGGGPQSREQLKTALEAIRQVD
jgi:thiol-disulfide isomerase/thioredoxin